MLADYEPRRYCCVVSFIKCLVLSLSLILGGCGGKQGIPQQISADDPQLQPFAEAISRVDRVAMGFTPQPISGDIRITKTSGYYDAMLHIANRPGLSRVIAFKKIGDSYQWFFEQEQHAGTKTYPDPDGLHHQEVVFILHYTEAGSGYPAHQTAVTYTGEDPRLADRPLTLEYVRPILQEWERLQHRTR